MKRKKYFTSIKWWFLNLQCFIIAFPVYAQVLQQQRLEFPISSSNESYTITPAGMSGIILHRRVGSFAGDQLEIIHTDTSFQQKWNGYVPIERDYTLAQHISSRNHLYLIFHTSNFSDRNFHLYEINLSDGTYTRFIVRNIIPFSPTVLEVTSQAALIGGYFNRVPIVIFFQLTTQHSKILPGLFNETGELTQVKIHSDGSFDLLISAKNYQRQQTLWLKNYSVDGGLIRNIMLKPEGNSSLIFGRTLQTKSYDQIIAGVYGSRNSEYSRGLFVARISEDGMQNIRYYNFADLENFFSYMRAKRERRIKERIERKKIKGNKIKFQYRFIVHEFVPYKNQFVLLGEAFYPKYRHTERMYSPTQSFGSYQNAMIFDGYQYTHAVVLGIDSDGNLLWDNSFEVNDVKTFTLEQYVKMDAREDNIALLYLYDNKIRTKLIQDSEVLEGKSFNPLLMQFDETLSADEDRTSMNKLEYWYDNHFLAYGTQTIVSPGLRKRKVFFVNKVRYH